MSGGFGNAPWGSDWGGGGGAESGGGSSEENIPTSPIWTQFDLRGVRQPDDVDRVLDFVETSGFSSPGQFFTGSFNLASGGTLPTTPALLDIDVPLNGSFTLEYVVTARELPENFDDPETVYMLGTVTDASGPCATILLSKAGIAYTGAVAFEQSNDYRVRYDQVLDPAAATVTGRNLFILPGSDAWFTEGEKFYIRFIVDYENKLAYLFVTAATEISSGSNDTDSAGHILRALLPVFEAADAENPPIDRISTAVAGTATDEAWLEIFSWNLSARALIPDLPPRAIPGADQASRLCGIVQLDGSASFDPEGQPLEYEWRFIEGPEPSAYVSVGTDGATEPETVPSGFTDKFTSAELGTINNAAPVIPGDVLLVGGVAYTISSVKPDDEAGTFYVLVERPQIPDDFVSQGFKLCRSSLVSNPTAFDPTFYPDVPGFYLFDLQVFDGIQWSSPSGLNRTTTVVNVLESPLPRGCAPDLDFIFDYLGDFWNLVEDKEIFGTFWASLAQSVATELFTLWQHEYSKSVRDIPRQFARRWLHYDLVLGEPVPELTSIFPVWGAINSSVFTDLLVNNRRLGLRTNLLQSDVDITFTGLDPAEPESFAQGLQRELRQRHPSFTVKVIKLNDGVSKQLSIRADGPLEVTDVTNALFTPGDTSNYFKGSGEKVAPRTVKVDQSFEGVSLSEAFLVIGENTYTVDRVVTDESDAFPAQRVVLRRDMVEELGDTFDWKITGWAASELLDFYNGMVTDGDFVDFEVTTNTSASAENAKTFELVGTVAFGASPLNPGRMPVDLAPLAPSLSDPDLTVSFARVIRKGRLPVDDLILDIPTLVEDIALVDDTATLRRNLDFFIEEYRGLNTVRFVSGQGAGPDVFEGQRPPFRLWAEYTYLDNKPTIENNFGLLVDFTAEQAAQVPSNIDYLSAVAGLMYLYTNGPTLRNLRIGTQILIGLPYAEEDGIIEEIRKDLLGDQGRLLLRDVDSPEIVRSYTFPKALEIEENPETGLPYAVGDRVERFSPLVEGAEVLDYVKDPTWFQGIINQGVFVEVQKFHTFAVRVDSRTFNLSSLLLVQNFIRKIKPTYTQPKFIVNFSVSSVDGDQISVNDTISKTGMLRLEDGVCRYEYGSSGSFDDAWAGGGQPWAGDPGGAGQPYRNRFDYDNDPDNPPPTPPTGDDVDWGFDKQLLLCPTDQVTIGLCQEYPVAFIPTFDSVFSFDMGVESRLAGEDSYTSAVTIPAGAVGFVLPLAASSVLVDGTLTEVNAIFLGPVGAETEFELVVSLNSAEVAVIPFSFTQPNKEVLAPLSTPVVASDGVQVSVRLVSQAAYSIAWTSIIARVSTSVPWAFDTELPAGEYCGVREV